MATMHRLVDVTPETPMWTYEVRVAHKSAPKHNPTTGKRHLHMFLEDKEGIRISAMVFNHGVEMYDMTMKLNSSYHILNANVRVPQNSYKVPDMRYGFTWVLNRRTAIQPCENANEAEVFETKRLSTFSDLYQHMKTGQHISMIVVVIDKLPRETQSTSNGVRTIKDFIVVDELLKPVQFTLWDELALTKGVEIFDELTEKKYPIVNLEDIKVTDFKGISSTSMSHSTVTLNSDLPRVAELEKWAIDHKSTLDAMKVGREFLDAGFHQANPDNKTITH